jgi:hypothetical protein
MHPEVPSIFQPRDFGLDWWIGRGDGGMAKLNCNRKIVRFARRGAKWMKVLNPAYSQREGGTS